MIINDVIESFVYDLSNVIENISVCKRRRGDSSNRKGRNWDGGRKESLDNRTGKWTTSNVRYDV